MIVKGLNVDAHMSQRPLRTKMMDLLTLLGIVQALQGMRSQPSSLLSQEVENQLSFADFPATAILGLGILYLYFTKRCSNTKLVTSFTALVF